MPCNAANYVIARGIEFYVPRFCEIPTNADDAYHGKFLDLVTEIFNQKFRQPYSVESVTYRTDLLKCRAFNNCHNRVLIDTSRDPALDVTDQGQIKESIKALDRELKKKNRLCSRVQLHKIVSGGRSRISHNLEAVFALRGRAIMK